MKRSGLFSAFAVMLVLVPAAGFAQNDNHEIDVYAGALFGDDVTEGSVSGSQPELDDDATFGIRYTYFFTPAWGIEASLGFTPGTVTGVATAPGGEIDMDVYTLDVDGIWTYTPEAKTVGYLVFGVGAASADLDTPITGTANGSPVVIDDDTGFTLNAGAGVKFRTGENFLIRLEGRYRFVDTLVEAVDDSLNTVETTVGVAWTF